MKKVFSRKARALTLVLSAALILAIALPFATKRSATTFSDLATNHWAYADIMALYQGGLVNGAGNNTFLPDEQLTIAQMATMIANAKGAQTGAANGKWYYKAVDVAIKGGYLPKMGETPADTAYDQPCSRELAVYMVIEGLGLKPEAKLNGKEATDIPDYGQISRQYRQNVLAAVQHGVIAGIDEKGTFAPQMILTRAQICAILARAGYTEAAPKAQDEDGLSNQEIYDAIKATGLFEETTKKDAFGIRTFNVLTAKDRKYAQLSISYGPDGDSLATLAIEAREIVKSLEYDSNYNVLDENGNIFSTANEDVFYNTSGKYMPASGLSYTSRQLLQQIMRIAFPNDSDEAIADIKAVMTPPFVYTPTLNQMYPSYPGKVDWIDGHAVSFNMAGSRGGGYSISICSLNDKDAYDQMMRGSEPRHTLKYENDVRGGNGEKGAFIDYISAYELNKW